MQQQHDRQHAVVIGGSMGGLLACRVLAVHFQKVTLIERDALPDCPGLRKGVPQARHTHGLLPSGARVLEQLFPGITADLESAGGIPCDPVHDGLWFHEGAPLLQTSSGLRGVIVSRPLLEFRVRQRVLGLPNVQLLQGEMVERVLTQSPDGKRIGAVKTGSRILDANLVVDASGRASHAPHWLKDLGFAEPLEDRVEIGVAYATRIFRRRPHHLQGKTVVVIPPTPLGKRGGVALAQEGGRWTVTLFNHFQKSPPLDLAGFIEFARTLPAPYLHEIASTSEPLCEGAPARMPASVRRRYEGMKRFPEGFLVFGDAICSFNPIYGQGMSVAALEAAALDRELSRDSQTGLAERFFAAAARIIDIPWSMAVGNDLRIPETTGPRTLGTRFANWYVSHLHRAAHHDRECSLAFHQVAGLLAPPSSLMRPAIAWRVFRNSLFSDRTLNTCIADRPAQPRSASSL